MGAIEWGLPKPGHIFDIRESRTDAITSTDPLGPLSKGELPKAWAYQDGGVQKWKTASQCPGYYQTSEEIYLIEKLALNIGKRVKEEAIIMDFGAGATEKILPLLQSLDNMKVKIIYLALDLSYESVKAEVSKLPPLLKHVQVSGVCGRFKDGLKYLKRAPDKYQRIEIWFGSTLFSDSFPWMSPTFQMAREILRPGKYDFMLVGQDCHTKDLQKVEKAYHTNEFSDFISSAVQRINIDIGEELLQVEGCSLRRSKYGLTHCFNLETTRPIRRNQYHIEEGTTMEFFHSYKPELSVLEEYFTASGLNFTTSQGEVKGRATQSYIFLANLDDLNLEVTEGQ